MLSATPVNNRFSDLKNQLALAYEGTSEQLEQKLSTEKDIDEIFRRAQAAFNNWSQLAPEKRTPGAILEQLDFDFFELLDSVTIARSRKHVQTFYDTSEIGTFPERLKPVSFHCPLTHRKDVIGFNDIFSQLSMLKLAVYLNDKLRVTPLQYYIQRGEQRMEATYDDIQSGEAFMVKESSSGEVSTTASSAVKYDLIGNLAESTQLRRSTIAEILKGLNVAVFGQFKRNPEDFLSKAATLINEQKATVIIEHLSYSPLEQTHTLDIFTSDKTKHDLSKGIKADRHIYDYVFTDSNTERDFVTELDTSTDVVVYSKLPRGFYIPTPVGNYNPDWAIAFEAGKVRHVYFIAETKGSMSSLELREVEKSKIECARRFFANIAKEDVKYDVVDSYGSLMELVGS